MSKKSYLNQGYILLDEEEQSPLRTHDDIPSISGLTQEELTKRVREGMLPNKEAGWNEYLGPETAKRRDCMNLDILLPNGLLLPTICPIDDKISLLKATIYKHMKRLPFSENVKDINFYVFTTVSEDGEVLELHDEDRTFKGIPLFLPLLSLKEPKDIALSKKISNDIYTLLGADLEHLETFAFTDELRHFRSELFTACQRSEQDRGTTGVLHYEFPEETILPNVGDRSFTPDSHCEVHEEDIEFWWFPNLPTDAHTKAMERLRKKVERSRNGLQVWFSTTDGKEYNEYVNMKDIFEKTPSQIIIQTLKDLKKFHEHPSDFILQVAGKRTFVTRNLSIIRYEYIRSCFENYRQPVLLLRRKHAVFSEFPMPEPMFIPFYVRAVMFRKRFPIPNVVDPICFWDLDANVCVQLTSILNVEIDNNDKKLYIVMAVALGRHILAEQKSIVISALNPRWPTEEGMVDFGMYVKDVPESAQLSLTLVKIVDDKHEPVGYVNIRLFDWQSKYVRGKHSLNLWPFPPGVKSMLNLMGTLGPNHDMKAVRLEIEVLDEDNTKELEYPHWPLLEEFVVFTEINFGLKRPPIELEPITRDSKTFKRLIDFRMVFDGTTLSEDDQIFLWDARFKIQELFPQMILILADCPMIYKEREYLCEFYTLLNDWPQLYIDTAMELLDVRFVDRYVRAFAVRHLDKTLDNDQMLIYMLPLVQALKYECYANSPLADMLLCRSLMDYRIGHTFFWLMNSELSIFRSEEPEIKERPSAMYLRFAILLEAYCRGNASHMEMIIKQKEMVDTLTELSKMVKSYALKDMATKKLRTELLKHRSKLENIPSPLNPCCRLGEIMIDQCRVLGSAKMPMRLTWANPEPLSHFTTNCHEIIFKNGDDLRQDLLTLQVMRIFDAKWKNYNLDFCLTLYEVLPMGENIGMINVVQNCQTIFQIQCASKQLSSSIGIDQKFLNRYLYDMCTKDKELNSKQYISF